MPQVRPITDLRNTTEISELYHSVNRFLLPKTATAIYQL